MFSSSRASCIPSAIISLATSSRSITPEPSLSMLPNSFLA
jgi:hypothetical protein